MNKADINKAELLIKSLNQFGGKYSQSKLYIVFKESWQFNFDVFKKYNASLMPLQIDSVALAYPFAYKAYACAQIEKIVADQNCDLVWLDNECLILSQPDGLVLQLNKQCVFRSVFLSNTVGQDFSTEPDAFWMRIYNETKVDPKTIPTVETFIDSKKIRFYINCQVITVNPKFGIFSKWEKIFTALLKDGEFQKLVCADALHQIFLHQAVLSAVIISKIKPEEMQWFSNDYGYPVHQNGKIPTEKKLSVNNVKVLLYENIFSIRPNWLDDYNVQEPMKGWILRNKLEIY